MKITIGTPVERVAADYTAGRQGTVIEINADQTRARVMWTRQPDGSEMRLRTWIKISPDALKVIA